MTLMKLSGRIGSKVYNPRVWSLSNAEIDYINTFGIPCESVDRTEFDVINTAVLIEWLNSNDELSDD